MLLIFLHDLVGPGQQNGGGEERHVDEDFPLDVLGVLVRHVDEGFQQMDAGDADQRGREFNLDRSRIDMGEPVRPVGV